MGMFLTIIESGSGGSVTLNVTETTILFEVVPAMVTFEVINNAIEWVVA